MGGVFGVGTGLKDVLLLSYDKLIKLGEFCREKSKEFT